MDSRTYYYARVSTKDQNLDRQISAFLALGAQEREIITDKESGKDLERKGYQALKMQCSAVGTRWLSNPLTASAATRATSRTSFNSSRTTAFG